MIPWVQVYSNLIQHPKTSNLAEALKLASKDADENVIAAGLLVSLWLWAAQNATGGDLGGCSDRAIAKAAGYRKAPGPFVAALKEAGFLDEDKKLHDWEEYATLLIDVVDNQKEQTRERVRKYRERKKGKEERNGNVNCNVTERYEVEDETLCNAPTVPNHTVPNITLHTPLSSYPSTSPLPPAPPAAPSGKCDIAQIVELYNAKCPGLAPCKLLSDMTRFSIRERWKQHPDLRYFQALFDAAQRSDLLTGKKTKWRADLDWLMQEKNFSRVINGSYDDAPGKPEVPTGASGQLGEAELEAIRQVMAAPDSEEETP